MLPQACFSTFRAGPGLPAPCYLSFASIVSVKQGRDRHGYRLLVTGPQRWVAAVVGGMLAMLAVGVLVGPRLLHATPSRTGGTHATVVSLPPGVCPLSTEGWPTGLTRIEAKLVTYESYFGSSTPDTASSARATQRTTSPPPYFWVIAATGNYDQIQSQDLPPQQAPSRFTPCGFT